MSWQAVDETELRKRIEHELDTSIVQLEHVSASSNLVYRANADDGSRYSVRVAHLDPSHLSAFWNRMERVFGHTYRLRLDGIDDLLRKLSAAGPEFELPTHLASFSLGDLPVSVFRWIEGRTWEPDDFPDSAEVQGQLGRYLGRVHLGDFERVGTIRGQTTSRVEFLESVTIDTRRLLQVRWRSQPEVARRAEQILGAALPDELAGRIAPMMPDISGNQFVYAGDGISGLVDIDSYVIGPVEWELSVVEMTLNTGESFRTGYEESLQLPRFDAFRDYYRLVMFLSGPDEENDLNDFLSRRKHFK